MSYSLNLIMMMFFANISQVKASTLHLEAALSQDGQLINTPQAITVSIHKDSPTSTEVWTNDFSEVPFDQGQFTLDLGSIQNKIDPSIFDETATNHYIKIKIGLDEAIITLNTVPRAFFALESAVAKRVSWNNVVGKQEVVTANYFNKVTLNSGLSLPSLQTDTDSTTFLVLNDNNEVASFNLDINNLVGQSEGLSVSAFKVSKIEDVVTNNYYKDITFNKAVTLPNLSQNQSANSLVILNTDKSLGYKELDLSSLIINGAVTQNYALGVTLNGSLSLTITFQLLFFQNLAPSSLCIVKYISSAPFNCITIS